MKKLLLLFTFMIGMGMSAQWDASVSVDEFTDEKSSIPYVVGEGNDYPYNTPMVAYYKSSNKFAIISSGYYSEDYSTLTVRVDKGEVFTLQAFVGSGNKTLVFSLTEDQIEEFKKGTTLLVKTNPEYGDSNTMKFSLVGFTSKYDSAY